MSIRVVDDQCRFANGKFVMVVESENLGDLLDGGVLKYALGEAARFGLPGGKLNGHDAPLPVEADGTMPDDYTQLTKLANSEKPCYRKKIYLLP